MRHNLAYVYLGPNKQSVTFVHTIHLLPIEYQPPTASHFASDCIVLVSDTLPFRVTLKVAAEHSGSQTAASQFF